MGFPFLLWSGYPRLPTDLTILPTATHIQVDFHINSGVSHTTFPQNYGEKQFIHNIWCDKVSSAHYSAYVYLAEVVGMRAICMVIGVRAVSSRKYAPIRP